MNTLNMFGNSKAEKETKRETLAFGIDLGTTNSAISVIANKNYITPIKLDSGKNTMPSCVMWNGTKGGFVVGEEAYKRLSEVEHCVYSIKRHMEDPTYRHTFTYKGESITMTPAEISAEILKALAKKTNGVFGEIKDVVVTVPAYFTSTGREATIEACKIAGFNLLGLLVEPSSAALTYNLEADEESNGKNIVVYDLGGGTFDISLIRLSKQETSIDDDLSDIYDFDDDDDDDSDAGNDNLKDVETHYKVIDVSGDSHLGGDDCDLALYKIMEKRIAETGVNVKYLSESFKVSLIHRLENFKKMDINSDYVLTVNTTLTDKNKTVISEKISLHRSDFVSSMMTVYKRTVKLLKNLLDENKFTHPVNEIILIGGSTKSQIIRDALAKDFPDFFINHKGEPDLSVAMGAGISAKVSKFGDKSIKIFDVLPMAIYIKDEGKLSTVIPKASELPVSATRYFTTVADNQTGISVEIYQGDSFIPEESTFLGNIYIDGIEPKPAGEVNICITALIDVNGVLRCTTTIGNITKDVVLDLNGRESAKKLTKEERRVIRWKLAANGLKDKKRREEALKMIDSYPKYVTAEDISNLLRVSSNYDRWDTEISKFSSDINKSKILKMIKKYTSGNVSADEIDSSIDKLKNDENIASTQ